MNILNSKISKWFFNKYFGIPKDKEIFKIQKTSIHYKNVHNFICREFGRNLIDIPNWLKHLFHIWDTKIANKYIPFLNLGYDTDTASTNNKDTRLNSSAPTTNYGTDGYGYAYSATGRIERMIFHFTLSNGTGVISSVKLYLYCAWKSANGATVNVHSLTRTNWTEAGATWNKYDGTTDWTVAGGDYSATVIDSVAVNTSSATHNFILMGTGSDNPLTLTWGDQIHLLIKKSSEPTDSEGVQFETKEDATPANRPYIEITYTLPVIGAAFLLNFI